MSRASRDGVSVAVVGSGPSGFYAAQSLLRSREPASVVMLERLPVPFGLVRSGVAPDHPKLKSVTRQYAKIAGEPGFFFRGNVDVGRDVSVDELLRIHEAVILAYGAASDRKLSIDGEALMGSHTATDFVGWYNGHPDFRERRFDLNVRTAVIIGNGNVAVDVARILAKSPGELAGTDIAAHALEALRNSRIRDIYIVGRRGPAQSQMSSKELRELTSLTDVAVMVHPDDLCLSAVSMQELDDPKNDNSNRLLQLFRELADAEPRECRRRIHLLFCRSPVRIVGRNRVSAIELEHNALTGPPFAQRPVGTGQTSRLEAQLVFRSIGYRGLPLPGVPFDAARGTVPNRDGRVVHGDDPVRGLYVTGWIGRGPSGLIGDNRMNSVTTVNSLIDDISTTSPGERRPGLAALDGLLNERGVRTVQFSDWTKIDASEMARGQVNGKPREKYTSVGDMLSLLR